MAVVISSPDLIDFNFKGTCSTPFVSAPSTPKRFGEIYCSAPTTPSRASAIYHDFDHLSDLSSLITGSRRIGGGSYSANPFDFEEKPKSKSTNNNNNNNNNNDEDDEYDFAFNFSGQHERASLSAEELFDGGVIRPLTPPPRLQLGSESPRSPRSTMSRGKKMIREVFSPRKRKDSDPFAVAIEEARKGLDQSHNRGREREPVSMSSRSRRGATRSLSPIRVSEFACEEQRQQQQAPSISKENTSSSSSSSSSSLKGSKKWRLKDLLLFRSASEGRASEKDPLRKYTALAKKDSLMKNNNTGFQPPDRYGLVSGSSPIRKGPVSPHELHYVANRAVSEDMKKKTFLPYKQGLLSVTRAFGYFTRK